eukprot:scaffold667_cov117-Cylindrotheca_fusiformis.AAC.13
MIPRDAEGSSSMCRLIVALPFELVLTFFPLWLVSLISQDSSRPHYNNPTQPTTPQCPHPKSGHCVSERKNSLTGTCKSQSLTKFARLAVASELNSAGFLLLKTKKQAFFYPRIHLKKNDICLFMIPTKKPQRMIVAEPSIDRAWKHRFRQSNGLSIKLTAT